MPGPVSRGRFVWYDLMTSDPDSAADFYTKVAGWGSMPWEGGEAEDGSGPYVMWTVGEKPIGGRALLPEDAKAQGAPGGSRSRRDSSGNAKAAVLPVPVGAWPSRSSPCINCGIACA